MRLGGDEIQLGGDQIVRGKSRKYWGFPMKIATFLHNYFAQLFGRTPPSLKRTPPSHNELRRNLSWTTALLIAAVRSLRRLPAYLRESNAIEGLLQREQWKTMGKRAERAPI